MMGYCIFCGETADALNCYNADFAVVCDNCNAAFSVCSEETEATVSKIHKENHGHLPNTEMYLSAMAVKTSYFCPVCRSNLYEDFGDLFCCNCNTRVYASVLVDDEAFFD